MKIRLHVKINSAFSLVELLAVTAIIAIIAAFAVPNYMNYLTETKLNSMWQQAEAAKMAVASQYLKQNTTVSSIAVDSGTKEYTTTTTDFIKCITIQNGVVSVVAKPESFNNLNIWISWTPTVTSGAITWACKYSSDAAQFMSDAAPSCSVGTAAYAADAACT